MEKWNKWRPFFAAGRPTVVVDRPRDFSIENFRRLKQTMENQIENELKIIFNAV